MVVWYDHPFYWFCTLKDRVILTNKWKKVPLYFLVFFPAKIVFSFETTVSKLSK